MLSGVMFSMTLLKCDFVFVFVPAEIGDFDPQVHGTDYLSEFQLLPKVLPAHL